MIPPDRSEAPYSMNPPMSQLRRKFERLFIRPILNSFKTVLLAAGADSTVDIARWCLRRKRRRETEWPPVVRVYDGRAADSTTGAGRLRKRVIYVFVGRCVTLPINTGVQRVTRGLAAGLVENGETVRFVVWCPHLERCRFLNAEERRKLAHWNGPVVQPNEEDIYSLSNNVAVVPPVHDESEQSWLIVPEVTHTPEKNGLLTKSLIDWARAHRLKKGFLFYDAIPLYRPEMLEIRGLHASYMRQLAGADHIWPISYFAADELRSFWSGSTPPVSGPIPCVTPVHLPADSFRKNRATCLSGNGEPPTILCVGSIEPRKQQVQLLEWFHDYLSRHPESDWRLLFIGNAAKQNLKELQKLLEKDSRAILLQGASDEQLAAAYASCRFSVFPSVAEGFGMPIVESLAYGKPCVCANFGAMGEVAQGGGCLTVDTRNLQRLAQRIEALIKNDELYHRLSSEARARRDSSWSEYASDIMGSSTAVDAAPSR